MCPDILCLSSGHPRSAAAALQLILLGSRVNMSQELPSSLIFFSFEIKPKKKKALCQHLHPRNQVHATPECCPLPPDSDSAGRMWEGRRDTSPYSFHTNTLITSAQFLKQIAIFLLCFNFSANNVLQPHFWDSTVFAKDNAYRAEQDTRMGRSPATFALNGLKRTDPKH
ncbi:unnamed protein product [Natator depressus]